MKKNAKPDKKLSPRRVISNNLYILKLIYLADSSLISLTLLSSLMLALTQFVSNIYLLRYAINGIDSGLSFPKISFAFLIWVAIRIIIVVLSTFFDDWIYRAKVINVSRYIHKIVYMKATEVDLECYENPEYYDDFSRAINECELRVDDLLRCMQQSVYVCTSFVCNLVLIISIDLFLLLFILIPLGMTFVEKTYNEIKFKSQMEQTTDKRRRDYARRTFYLVDYAKEMRLSGMSDLMLRRFKEASNNIVIIIKKYGCSLLALQYILHESTDILTALGATIYTVWQSISIGNIGYGDCVVIVSSLDRIAYSLRSTSQALTDIQDNALYIENLRKFMEYEPSIVDGTSPLPCTGDLVLENVSFRYAGASHNAINGISMSIGPNEKIAIVGHNGAGKTTLVKLLLRLYDCHGQITYGGISIKDFPKSEYRDIFSTVMQNFHIFSLTLAENVLLRKPTENDTELIAKALARVGLGENTNNLASGTNTQMTKEFDESGCVLSGGEQQKLAIAHIHTKKSRFVILDEPSSALDPIAEHNIYVDMMSACQNCGVILIAHRLSSVVSADKIYLMENGSIIESGNHSELMRQNGRYAEMFRKQAEGYMEA